MTAAAAVTALVMAGCGAQVETGAGPQTTTRAGAGGPSDDVAQPTEDVFNVLSPWNTPVDDDRVQAGSAAMLRRATVATILDFDGDTVRRTTAAGLWVNTTSWTPPIVAGGVPTVLHCRQVHCGDGRDAGTGDGDLTLDIPADVDPNPLYDGWFTVFDPAAGTAYDLWRARRESDGTISYSFVRQWELDGPGFQQPYVLGARGSGLPLFGGLIRPGELERGQIDHALAISLPGPAKGYFVQPASSTDGDGATGSVPEGARLRLRSTYQLAAVRAEGSSGRAGSRAPLDPVQADDAETLVRALKTYGAIVVGRSAVPTLYFENTLEDSGVRPPLRGAVLSDLHLGDFEVMDFSHQQEFAYPPPDETLDPGVS